MAWTRSCEAPLPTQGVLRTPCGVGAVLDRSSARAWGVRTSTPAGAASGPWVQPTRWPFDRISNRTPAHGPSGEENRTPPYTSPRAASSTTTSGRWRGPAGDGPRAPASVTATADRMTVSEATNTDTPPRPPLPIPGKAQPPGGGKQTPQG